MRTDERRFRALLFALALLLSTLPATAAEGPCDPGLLGTSSSPQAYRARGDRCEGLYALQVNSTQLSIRSFTELFASFDAALPEDLLVSWSPPPGTEAPLHLRVYGIAPELYYRMDAEVPAAAGAFVWNADLLAALDLAREDLGATGSLPLEVDGESGRLYLPLRIRQGGGDQPGPGSYQVTLVPSRRLEEVYLTLVAVGEDGATGETVRDRKALGYGFYPADQPTPFDLEGLPRPGLYRLDVEGQLRDGSLASTRLFFYHPPSATRGEAP